MSAYVGDLMDAQSAMVQAGQTADFYMRYAIDKIDQRFGDGFAEKNPALICTFMNVAAADFAAAPHTDAFPVQVRRIAESISDLVEAVSTRR